MHSLSFQWHELLIKTCLDDKVFTPCKATPVQTVQQIRDSVPEWILRHYAWGLDFSAKLSTGYILPKPSRMFKKARPIINYSTSWPRKLGQAIGTALLEILNVVYSDLLKLQDVHAVLEQIRLLLQVIVTDERIFEIHQSDIAGFYNQVEHDRILQAVDFAIHRFCALQQVSLESSIQTHTHKSERTLCIFRGQWRSQSKQFREFKLSHLRDLVKFLLQNSFFHVGTQVFRQHRGASMGSQWAPFLCSAVALMGEYNFSRFIPCCYHNHTLHTVTLTIVLLFFRPIVCIDVKSSCFGNWTFIRLLYFWKKSLGINFWVFALILINALSLSVNLGHRSCVAVAEVVPLAISRVGLQHLFASFYKMFGHHL